MKYSILLRRLHIVVFAIMFGALLVLTCRMQSDDWDLQAFEKRKAYALPPQVLSGVDLPNIPRCWELYVDDRIPFRGPLITFRNTLYHKLWGFIDSDVVFGKNQFLFNKYKDMFYPENVAGRKLHPFTEEQLQKHAEYFLAASEWLSYRKIPYVLVVVPTKQSIYPEQLQPGSNQIVEWTRTEQLLHYLQKNNITVIDVRDEVKRRKQEEPVFFKYDTHWNSFGAFHAYNLMIAKLSKILPSISPVNTPYKRVYRTEESPDLGLMSRLPQFFREPTIDVARVNYRFRYSQNNGDIVSQTEDRSAPRALVYRDSMFMHLLPLFADHFSFARYRKQNYLEPNDVEKYAPDLVVQEMSECTLANQFIKNQFSMHQLVEQRFKHGDTLVGFDNRDSFVFADCKRLNDHDLVSASSDPKIEFYCPTDSRSEERLLRVEIESQRESLIQLFYAKNNAEFSSGASATEKLHKGHNKFYFRLAGDVTRIRIDPCDYAGEFKLAMEARVCPGANLALAPIESGGMASRFYAGEKRFAFPAASATGIERMENCATDNDSGSLICFTADPQIHFTESSIRSARILRACAEVDQPTYLQLFYASKNEDFSESRSIPVRLLKGKNELFLSLPEGASKFRLDPCATKGKSVVSFQVAAVSHSETVLAQKSISGGNFVH
jgi:alginate O-acetyltransferase complex protein AlgJ